MLPAAGQTRPQAQAVSPRLLPEDELALVLKHAKIKFTREVQAVPGRKFRWDFACEHSQKMPLGNCRRLVTVLVEVQGGVYMRRGGHNTGAGITRDCEKACLAAVHGYRVLPVTTEQVRSGQALIWIEQALGIRDLGQPDADETNNLQ